MSDIPNNSKLHLNEYSEAILLHPLTMKLIFATAMNFNAISFLQTMRQKPQTGTYISVFLIPNLICKIGIWMCQRQALMDKFSSTIPHQMRLLFSSIMLLPLPMGLHSPRTKIILWYVKLGSKSISSWSFPLFSLCQLIESLVTCRCRQMQTAKQCNSVIFIFTNN